MSKYSLAHTKKFVLFILIAILISVGTTFAKKPKITVFGSSVAYGNSAKDNKGYWFSLKEVMEPRGWEVSSCSRGGDRTSRILDRFDDLLSHEPDYVFIGLSLANEGIREKNDEERDAIYIQYKWGIKGIIALLRSRGIEPVIGLCYPHSYYTPIEIDYVKRMNLLMNTWDVPSANFLGAIDDTSGGWAVGYYGDPYHPNTEGHAEMFYTIVPSVFDAMEAGKPTPTKASGSDSIELGAQNGKIVFEPQNTVHSWAISFWAKGRQGNTALASASNGTVAISPKGATAYTSENTKTIISQINITDGNWHHVVVSHMYAHGQTQLFIDANLAGTVSERIAPDSFSIGGNESYYYKEWMVYRAALNRMEVDALYKGKLLQASLEVYAPLQDEMLKNGEAVENRAQSMSEAIYKK
jgi:lysophospholipase L1-like esterase